MIKGHESRAGKRSRGGVRISLICIAGVLGSAIAGRPADDSGPTEGVTDEMLLRAQAWPEGWVHYHRNYQGWRYAPLEQINRQTVKRLAPRWVLQTGIVGGGFEVTALAHDGRLFITTANSHLFCVDARTGGVLWRYDHVMPEGVNLCCGPVNRGVAIRGKKIYYGTLDARLMCFEAETGLQLWDRMVGDFREAYSLTLAPLIVGNKVIVGVGGAEYGVRGFIDAYDAETGERLWRFYAIPGPGEPGRETWGGDSWMNGGGSTWLTGTYDPELNLLYWGIGNPAPDFNGDVRPGDNLYTDCVVALDPETGRLVWHFQATPHDIFDWDAVSEPVLIDATIRGRPVKALLQANRNGYLYALDRTNGQFLYASPYSKVNWADLDAQGKPVVKPDLLARRSKHVCPGVLGGKNWPPTAYSPRTGLIYIPDMNLCSTFSSMDIVFRRGLPYLGGMVINDPPSTIDGGIRAVEVATGEIKWSYGMKAPNWAGLLATAGGVVFGGAPDGYLRAFDDETGEVLWEFQTGNGVFAPPTTFMLDGRQVIGLASGWSQMGDFMMRRPDQQRGCAYFLFGLMEP